MQLLVFEQFRRTDRLTALAEMVVCNSFREAEADAFMLLPNVLPI